MVNSSMKETFVSMENELKDTLSLLQKKISTISTLRVISFLAGAGLFIIGVADDLLWAEILGGIFLLVFIYLVKKHSDAYGEVEIADSKLEVVDAYVKRFGDEWRNFSRTGKEYLTKEDTVPSDLDLLGDSSLYQMINVAHTEEGRKKLVSAIKLEGINLADMENRNKAVDELMNKASFAVDFESAGIRLEKKKKKFKSEDFVKYCNDTEKGFLPKWANVIRIIIPIIVAASLVLWFAGVTSYGLPLICFLVTLAISWLTKTVTDKVIMPLYGVNYGIEDYLDMFEFIDQEDFESKYLVDIKENISGDKGAVVAFKQLKKISQAYNISYNPLFHQIFSGLFLWDYHLAYLMGKWKKQYGHSVSECFDNIGAIEELLSLAVVGVVRKVNWATINYNDTQKVGLKCEELYHPLIAPDVVVANTTSLSAGITIITGSNMSGKTTFLRTLAVNLTLAYMGAPICGKSLTADYMKIFTSMRVTDDVANGISTFYAEILRIKAMAEYKAKNLPMICLIDEIFKGTNSADRIVGATEAIKQLSGDRCMTVVSTHDFELCNITDSTGKAAINYHFEEYYNNDELKFDYTIKEGRCTTTNAKELLRMAGFQVGN